MPAQPIPLPPSTNLDRAVYDPDSQQLYIQFRTGQAYRYDGVTGEIADALSRAYSAGQYLRGVIEPRHPASPLDPDTAEGIFGPPSAPSSAPNPV